MLGNKTNRNNLNNNNKKNKENNKNHKFINKHNFTLKNLFPHIKGIPSSPIWSNHFSSLIFNMNYLLYISNSNIISINLEKKLYNQIITSNILNNDKPNVLLEYKNEGFITISKLGKILFFQFKSDNFVEDLNFNKKFFCFQIIEQPKCAIFTKNYEKIFVSNNNKLLEISININDGIINKENELIFKDKNIITDLFLYENYLFISLSNGNIQLYDINLKNKIFIIDNNNSENIFNIDFYFEKNFLSSIDKNGTLNIYKINFEENNYEIIQTEKNLFNDKAIDEKYLFFSLKFINDNDIIISSNEGRIFIYNINLKKIKEITENPHNSSIFAMKILKASKQIIFIGSDYKISIFSIENLNFKFCINTIPFKLNYVTLNENKIFYCFYNNDKYFLYQYNFTKKNNSLNTTERKINFENIETKIFYNKINNYFCFLNTKEINRILIFDYDSNLILYHKKLFEKNIDIIKYVYFNKKNDKILYLFTKNGKIIIFNYSNENYKILEFFTINKDLNISNIKIKEYNNNFLILSFLYNNQINIFLLNEIMNKNIIKIDFEKIDLIYNFKIIDNHIFIYYIEKKNINIIKIEINVNEIDYFEDNYEKYIEFQNKIEIKSKKNIFNNIFNNSQISYMNIDNKNNILLGQNDGIINYYKYDILNENLILLFIIKSHFLSINYLSFINENLIFSSSNSQEIKIFDVNNCNNLNIIFENENNNNNKYFETIKNKFNYNNKNFNFLASFSLFQQSFENAKIFGENFQIKNNIEDNYNIEDLLYTYYNNKQLNEKSAEILINYEIEKNKKVDKNNVLDNLYYFLNLIKKEKEFKNKNPNIENIFNEFKNIENLIDFLLYIEAYFDALILCKIFNIDKNKFIYCIEKLKKFLYLKNKNFQVIKLQKIIEKNLKN